MTSGLGLESHDVPAFNVVLLLGKVRYLPKVVAEHLQGFERRASCCNLPVASR